VLEEVRNSGSEPRYPGIKKSNNDQRSVAAF
jgi:hypothetical protein